MYYSCTISVHVHFNSVLSIHYKNSWCGYYCSHCYLFVSHCSYEVNHLIFGTN